MLKIEEVKSKQGWQDFLQVYPHFFPFFQTWNWGVVQQALGFAVYRFGIFEDEKLVGIAQCVVIKAKRGNYLQLRHGPLLLDFQSVYFAALFDYLKRFAKNKQLAFIRVSPLIAKESMTKLLQKQQHLPSPIPNMDSEICWVLDITKTEDQLLAQMRKTHRYLIKKTQTLQIEIIQSTSPADLKTFFSFYQDLAKRHHFVPHKGIKEELEILGQDDEAVLLLAKYNNLIIGGAVIVFAGNMAIYHHGASSFEYRNLPSAYLLQWEAIKEAKKRGKQLYNFWGVVPPTKNKQHAWQGLTLFKTGFGGELLEFAHAQDLPLSINYLKTYLIETFFKFKKGY